MSISIVMPCYNEESIIETVVRDYYEKIINKIEDSELIVVNDCSKDNTYNILNNLKNELPKLKVLCTPVNSGHGKATMMGYEFAEKEYIFQIDSDNQFESKDFWKLYSLKDNFDFIIGFRQQRHDPMVRLIITKSLGLINLLFFGVHINDANCPFRLMKKNVLIKRLASIDKESLAPNIMLSILAKKSLVRNAISLIDLTLP